jgi:hypothetical protein
MKLETEIAILDDLLAAHAGELAGDATAYRNHTYRVANLCLALRGDDRTQLDKIAITAAFHDIGIWTDGTFDYLEPSARRARDHLNGSERARYCDEVVETILQHHKLRKYRDNDSWIVEAFRRADLVDVSQGLIRFGLPRQFIRDLYDEWPSASFHKRLLQLGAARLRSHPMSPLPMLRL